MFVRGLIPNEIIISYRNEVFIQRTTGATESMRHLGLGIRMAVAGSILFVFYVLFALVLYFFTLGVVLYAGRGPPLYAEGISLIVTTILSVGFVGFQYTLGTTVPLKSVGAEEVSEDRFPLIHASLERLSEEMGIEKPRLMVADMGVPNAFVVGRKGAGVVVVASELLYVLDYDEVEGVLAHELAHIRNRDVMLMVMGHSIALMIFYMVYWAINILSLNLNEGSNAIIAYIVGSLTQLFALVFVLAISRYREYIADTDAAELVGSDPLMSALTEMREVGRRSPTEVKNTVAPLCILGGERSLLDRMFASHPPVEKRIERLRAA